MAGKGPADQAGSGGASFALRIFFFAAETIAAWRRGAHGDRALRAAYARHRGRQLETGALGVIMHDLFPDVLVTAGLLKPRIDRGRAMRGANALMFRRAERRHHDRGRRPPKRLLLR